MIMRHQNVNGLFQGQDNIRLKVMFWNADGLTETKFSELKTYIFQHDVDIYAIAEAGASTENINSLQLPGYQTYVLKRGRQVASGIVVGAKESLIVKFKILKEMVGSDKCEMVELEAWRHRSRCRLFFVYNPPRNQPNLSPLEGRWDNRSLLIGDLNAPSARWGYSNSDAVGRAWESFIDSTAAAFVENLTSEPTFLAYNGGKSHPDLVVAHTSLTPQLRHTLGAAPSGFGHRILLVDLYPRRGKINIEPRMPRWNLNRADWTAYRQISDSLIKDDLIDGNVDRSLERILKAIVQCAHKCIPRGQMRRYEPFWSEELNKLKEERDRARCQAESDSSSVNRRILREKCARLKRKIMESKQANCCNFLEGLDFRKDGLKAHRYISRLNNEKVVTNNPLKAGDKEYTSEEAIAKKFCSYFAGVSNFHPKKGHGKPSTQFLSTCLPYDDFQLFYSSFKMEELLAALKSTPKGRSAGPDNVLPEFLAHLGEGAQTVVLCFLNLVWYNHYPAEWRKAEVIPIIKKGKEVSDPASYRPISLTSSFSKLFERMLLQRLQCFLEKYSILSPKQAGFRKNRGTLEQVAQLSQDVKDGFHRKQSTIAVLVDFTSAFDRVWRKRLLEKMTKMGVGGRLFATIASFLSQRYIRVKHGAYRSGYRQVRQGLPQGSVLSPSLFNIMINDVVDVIERTPGVKALLYADDLVFWATSSNIVALQSCLNGVLGRLKEWSSKNEMIVSSFKTQCQLFTLSNKPHPISLLYDNKPINVTDSGTYLGVVLDNKLTWSKHVDKLSQQGERRSGLLRRLAGVKWGASQDVLSLAYKIYVRPAMEYGGELAVTASANVLKKLDIVQNKALRIITGGPISTPIAAMELQADVEPLDFRRELATLSLYERIKRSPDTYWNDYRPASLRLKTQESFICKAETMIAARDLTTLSAREVWPSHHELMPLTLAPYSMFLSEPVQKGITTSTQLKVLFLETVARNFPDSQWLHVYTDGSAQDANRNAGAGVYSPEFQISAPVGRLSTNFDGEIAAIRLALSHLLTRVDIRVVLFVDSQAAIVSVTENGGSDDSQVLTCRRLANDILQRGTTLFFQWCPSHCGILGNERADCLAKEGAQQEQQPEPITYRSAKRLIKSKLKEFLPIRYHETSRGKKWESLVDQPIPRTLQRRECVANFRLTTGHDYLAKHLHRIGVYRSPLCPLCDEEEMDGSHLQTCRSLWDVPVNDEISSWTRNSRLYWAARQKMADLPNQSEA